MPQPLTLDNRFETFVQALPADYVEQAYDFKAFTRTRKIKNPQQFLSWLCSIVAWIYRYAAVRVNLPIGKAI